MKLFHFHIRMLVITPAFFISSCTLLGIHRNVYNPKKPGTYPAETRRIQLLGASNSYRACYDVSHYELHVDVDPSHKFISGKVIIRAVALADFDTLQIDLYKNMHLQNVESDQQQLVFKREEGAVFIFMPKPIRKGERFELIVNYNGNPIIAKRPPWNGGFVWKKDKNKNPFIGVSCETEGASLWWPCKDLVSDEPDSADVFITVPNPLMAVSNGVLKETLPDGNKTTYHWHVSYPINNYNITLYIGDLKLLQDIYVSKLTGKTTYLNHYVLPYNYQKASVHFQELKPILEFYETLFGAYPWQKDGFKLVESPYEGMEHQSAIAYGNGYKDDFTFFDYIILHETAHEWWGNSVSAADLSDGWLHEGFASYCEALYVEKMKGKQAYLNYMYWQRLTIKNKRPVVRKRNIRYFDYHDEDIYNKGSWVLHTLRNTINNDSLFFDILKSFRIENNQKQILTDTFIALVNKKTGTDYNWFFKQYLYNRLAPFLEYYWDHGNFYYHWVNVDSDFKLPIEIKAKDHVIILHPSVTVQKISFEETDNKLYDNGGSLYYGTKENKKLPYLFKYNP
jgi:aminopeptidase N